MFCSIGDIIFHKRQYRQLFDEQEERIIMIVVRHVGSARLAFRRCDGIEGSLSAVECAAPVPEEFAGAEPLMEEAV